MTLRLLERIHGHLGWLAALALLHPAILLRNPKRSARLSAVLATLIAIAAGSLGAFVYPTYSRQLRRSIYLASKSYGLLFERKEHLAFLAVALAIAGCALHLGRGDSLPRARAAWIAFVASAALAVAVATMGTVIASFRSF
ncbi:MAG: hypothetical protein ACXWUG_24725 [Polyangiales bacterium]